MKVKIHGIAFTGQASGNNSLCGLWEAKHGHFEATYDIPKITCKRCLSAIKRKDEQMEKNDEKEGY